MSHVLSGVSHSLQRRFGVTVSAVASQTTRPPSLLPVTLPACDVLCLVHFCFRLKETAAKAVNSPDESLVLFPLQSRETQGMRSEVVSRRSLNLALRRQEILSRIPAALVLRKVAAARKRSRTEFICVVPYTCMALVAFSGLRCFTSVLSLEFSFRLSSAQLAVSMVFWDLGTLNSELDVMAMFNLCSQAVVPAFTFARSLRVGSPLVPPGIEGDGRGGRFIRSPCLSPYTRHCPFGPCTAAAHAAPGHNRWGVVETPLTVKTQGRNVGCFFNFYLLPQVLLQSGFNVSLRNVQQRLNVTWVQAPGMGRSVKWSCARRATPQQSVGRNAGARRMVL